MASSSLSERSLSNLSWRAMTLSDIDGVVAVARLAFPDHVEDRVCFEERLGLYPEGCFVLADSEGVAGYMVAYPWRANAAPPLNALIGAVPEDAAVLYLHDLALHPRTRGSGAAVRIVDQLVEQARVAGWSAIALVAVNDAAAFWGRRGFEAATPPGMAEKLASYGDDARYMVLALV